MATIRAGDMEIPADLETMGGPSTLDIRVAVLAADAIATMTAAATNFFFPEQLSRERALQRHAKRNT